MLSVGKDISEHIGDRSKNTQKLEYLGGGLERLGFDQSVMAVDVNYSFGSGRLGIKWQPVKSRVVD